MEPKLTPPPTEHPPAALRSYMTPQLKLYGSVLTLTASGTGMTSETRMFLGMLYCLPILDGTMMRKHCL